MMLNQIKEELEKSGFIFGRNFGSKSSYLKEHPDNLTVFNARIYDSETYEKHKNGKIKNWFLGQEIETWYGDLDLSKDLKELYLISIRASCELVVTTETGNKIISIGER